MPDDATVLHVCGTRDCRGLLTEGEPCPRCGRQQGEYDEAVFDGMIADIEARLEELDRRS